MLRHELLLVLAAVLAVAALAAPHAHAATTGAQPDAGQATPKAAVKHGRQHAKHTARATHAAPAAHQSGATAQPAAAAGK